MTVDKLVSIIMHQKVVMNGLFRKSFSPLRVEKSDIILAWKDYEDPVEFRKKIEEIGKDIVAYSFFTTSCYDSPGAVYFGIKET